MRNSNNTAEKILLFLKANKSGSTPSEIARKTGINRMTISKYLNILKALHFVDYNGVGMSKMYFVNKSPIFKGLDEMGSSSHIKRMVDDFGVGVVVADKDLKIRWFNRNVEKGTGKKSEDLKDRRCYEIFHMREEVCKDCPAKKTLLDGKVHKSVQSGKDKNGNTIFFRIITSPLYDINNKINGFLEMVVDLSDIDNINKELEQAKASLRTD